MSERIPIHDDDPNDRIHEMIEVASLQREEAEYQARLITAKIYQTNADRELFLVERNAKLEEVDKMIEGFSDDEREEAEKLRAHISKVYDKAEQFYKDRICDEEAILLAYQTRIDSLDSRIAKLQSQ